MKRLKIDYGIDLGTTNSAICRMKEGEPIVIKTDIQKDIMPSCISFTKKKSIRYGDTAYNDMKKDKRRSFKTRKKTVTNAYAEFKRTMGTDVIYHSSYMERDYTSEELSAEVLKTLKSFITDENFYSAVITVPAKFTVNQKTATLNAAKLAGLEHCELLQEPIAAAMAYGLASRQEDGYCMVFDFGGGTFDAALLKVEDGIMQVFDTEGDNYLGGKNLDYAIADNIIIPYLQKNYALEKTLSDKEQRELLRDAMKTYAEETKNQLSFKEKEEVLSDLGDLGEDEEGEEIVLDLTVTQEDIFAVMRPLFQKAVDICKDLLERNNMTGAQLNKLILVGGPTYSPLIRKMLKEQITQNVDTGIDPMTAVAKGAALYASTLDNKIKEEEVEKDILMFNVGYETMTVETTEWVSLKLTSGAEKAMVELVRGDKAWASGKAEITAIGDVLEVNLTEGKPNTFSIMAYDEKGNQQKCFPEEITIIQGSKIGSATLPYNIGIATWNEEKEKAIFTVATGLEKDKPLPAVGVKNGLKTTSAVRPGLDTDVVRIPVYQAEINGEGKSAYMYEYVTDVIINGEDVDCLIPADSIVDVTLKVDSSEQMQMEVYFPAFDITISKELDTSKKQSIEEANKYIVREIANAEYQLTALREEGMEVSALQQALEDIKTENSRNSERKQVLQHLKEVLRKIEEFDNDTEWVRLEKELREEFERLEKANNDLGNEKTTQIVNHLRSQTDEVIRKKDVKLGRECLGQIQKLFFQLTMLYQCIGLIDDCNKRFGTICWKDSNRARQLINQGLSEITNQPSIEKLQPIARALIEQMPREDAINAEGLLK